MNNKSNMIEKISKLREKLNHDVKEEDLGTERILSLSREVDDVIIEYYRSDDKLNKQEP